MQEIKPTTDQQKNNKNLPYDKNLPKKKLNGSTSHKKNE